MLFLYVPAYRTFHETNNRNSHCSPEHWLKLWRWLRTRSKLYAVCFTIGLRQNALECWSQELAQTYLHFTTVVPLFLLLYVAFPTDFECHMNEQGVWRLRRRIRVPPCEATQVKVESTPLPSSPGGSDAIADGFYDIYLIILVNLHIHISSLGCTQSGITWRLRAFTFVLNTP